MARILLTAVTADIRGSLAGSVFKESGSGLVIQTKSGGHKKAFRAGADTRQPIRVISQMWRELKDADAQAWRSFAANVPFTDVYGKTFYLAPNIMFARAMYNQYVALNTFDPITPVGWRPPAFTFTGFSAQNTPQLMRIDWNDYGDTSARAVVIYATPSLSPSIKNWISKLRFIRSMQITNTNVQTFTNDYMAVWPRPSLDARIGVRVKMIDLATFADSVSVFTDTVVRQ